jgi:hypothetical protein
MRGDGAAPEQLRFCRNLDPKSTIAKLLSEKELYDTQLRGFSAPWSSPGVEGGPSMLPPFIIEQIRKREKEQREQQAEQPRLELPVERRRIPEGKDEEVDRGVVVVDLG